MYDEHFDCVICPEYQVLNYSTTNRDGYREYKSDPKVCANCPTRHLCTNNKDCIKTVTRHIWKEYEDMADDARHTPIYLRMYKARKETIERVFADTKEKHGMRYTSQIHRLDPGYQLGEAYFCCHELEKVRKMELEG